MPANIKRLPSGSYRVQIMVGGRRVGRTFAVLKEAVVWRDQQRVDLRAQSTGSEGQRKTLRDAMRRYAEEVAPTHRGERWEQIRLAAMEGHECLPITLPIGQVTAQHLARWRRWREGKVGPASVRREMSLLGSVFAAARRDWHWIDKSPLSDVRRPPAPPPSDRTITRAEIRGMLRALGYRWGRRPASIKQVVAYALLLALRTGMRAGELAGLTWARVHPAWVELPMTKNGYARDVPLSRKAQRLMDGLRGFDDERPLPVTVQVLDATFRRARDAAGLSGFTFHASRHTAATWIGATVGRPGRLSFPEFVRVFGWRDPRNAMVYVNTRAEALAQKI